MTSCRHSACVPAQRLCRMRTIVKEMFMTQQDVQHQDGEDDCYCLQHATRHLNSAELSTHSQMEKQQQQQQYVFLFVDLKNQPLQASQQAPKCLLHTQLLKYVDRRVIWSRVVNNAARVGGASVVVGQRSVDGIVQLLLVEQLFNGGFVVEVSLGRARAPARAKFTHPVPITAAAVGLVESPSPAVRKQYRLYAVARSV
ncbi:S-adenosylmethionine:tRNA ribosyltransferase-isomerase [Trichinella spiralis]|uniref:S-adenosylmethionine:tRNA ribosyltransferase-isomerase n=1 Tax=Trichinella spiralis TaxID=6334 RepID=A0ABR3K8Q6_TRISP